MPPNGWLSPSGPTGSPGRPLRHRRLLSAVRPYAVAGNPVALSHLLAALGAALEDAPLFLLPMVTTVHKNGKCHF